MDTINNLSPYVRYAEYGIAPLNWKLKERVIFDFEIIYLKQGEVRVTVENRKYVGKPGDIFFFRPKQRHSLETISEAFIIQHFVHFDLNYFPDSEHVPVSLRDLDELSEEELGFFREDLLLGAFSIPTHIRLSNPLPFEKKMLDLIKEYEMKMLGYELQVKAMVIEMIVFLLRESHWKDSENTLPNYVQLFKLQTYLNHTNNAKITLDELAQLANMSKYHLVHEFKKSFGYSPIKYHQIVRIEKAKEMIRFTNYPLSHIASELGFDGIHSFSRAFKKIEGISPSFYRKAENDE